MRSAKIIKLPVSSNKKKSLFQILVDAMAGRKDNDAEKMIRIQAKTAAR